VFEGDVILWNVVLRSGGLRLTSAATNVALTSSASEAGADIRRRIPEDRVGLYKCCWMRLYRKDSGSRICEMCYRDLELTLNEGRKWHRNPLQLREDDVTMTEHVTIASRESRHRVIEKLLSRIGWTRVSS
jgi:hypothetical protein